MTEPKTILLIGRTGRGKSALANVITNTNNFKENEGSISETKEIQTEKFKNSNGLNYFIIDTPGIGDTQLPTEKILDIIAEAVYLVKDGVSQVFFTTNGRFDQYEMATYNLLRAVIFDKDITNYTTIIRTHFSNFRDEEECKDDVKSMVEKGDKLSEIIESCQQRIVYVDNPSLNIIAVDNEDEEDRIDKENEISLSKEKRGKSRDKLLGYLSEYCQKQPYQPPKLKELGTEIVSYMESKKGLEGELKEKLQVKKLRRLKVKIFSNFIGDSGSNVLTEDDNKKGESVVGRKEEWEVSGQIDNDQEFGTSGDIEKKIRKLEEEIRQLKEQIQVKENIIRQKVFQHIFNNYSEIVNIPGGEIFISSIKDDNWSEKGDEFIRVSQWLSQCLDSQLTQSWINDLKNYCGSGYLSFCVWLIRNKKLSAEEALNKDKKNIEQLINEYLQQSKEQKAELKTQLDLKSRQNWQLLNVVNRFQEEFPNWTSGSPEIDKFIQRHQSKATHWGQLLEWIPHEQFENIEYLAEGAFGKVYKAEWKEGPIKNWDVKNSKWERGGQRRVVLKSLDNSPTNTEFLQEIDCHKIFANDSNIINCYGISQDPNTKNYLMVLDYLKDGNLRRYLLDHYRELDFEDKLYLLYTISLGLNSIHKKVLVHRDFHSGNILVDEVECYIIDLGLSRSVDSLKKEDEIYGVLPYVAPEVLQEKGYTQAADVYSSGIVAYEVLTGLPPHHDKKYDVYLALKVCEGTRPRFQIKIPQSLENLISKCWDTNPLNRPTASELYTNLLNWYSEISDDRNTEFAQQVKIAEEFNQTLPEEIRYPNCLLKGTVLHSELLSNVTQELSTMSLNSLNVEDEWIAQQEVPYKQPDKS